MLTTLIIFVALLSLLIFVHEFGHFFVARRSGMAVEEFGFGFPPRLWGTKRGKTIYSINWIPLGGFVRIKGESGEDADAPDSFSGRPMAARLAVIVAGVAMNVALAWFLLSAGFLVGLPQIIEGDAPGRTVTNVEIHVYDVIKGSPADEAGLKRGDTLVAIGGSTFAAIEEVSAFTAGHDGEPLAFQVKRDGEVVAVSVTPTLIKETGRPGIGASLFETGFVSYPWYLAPWEGAKATVGFLKEITAALFGFFRDLLFAGRVSPDLSGPVGIAVLTGEVAKLGFRYVIQFAALLSLNLAVVNVLPLPALDGGRLAFLLVEAVRRRAVSRRLEGIVHSLGFVALIGLVLVVTYRDLVRYGGRIIETFAGLVGR
jgi:regulator of sigma E protease